MSRDTAPATDARIPLLSASDQLRALTRILAPPVVKGPIVRRPWAVGLAERCDLDAAGVEEMQRLRAIHGAGPVRLRLFGREVALLLDGQDVHRVLEGAPEPFTPATLEKRGALNHFEPESVLVSSAQRRRARRPLNEQVLETDRPVHSHAESMTSAIEGEIASLLGHADFTGELDWDGFITAWWRIVRRIVLGDSARDDEQLTDDLRRLRSRGNLSFFAPRHRGLRRRFLHGLESYVDRAEPGSLAAMLAAAPAPADAAPVQQIPQWLFAFDAAAWASFRALSLLTAAPGAVEAAREEWAGAPELPTARATMLESLRLWPTTPLLLRDTTEETSWRSGTLAAGTAVVIFAPFFHRDENTVAEAHRFSPQLWREGLEAQVPPLVPFSGGPGMCPGRNVVLLTSSMVLGRLVHDRDVQDLDPLDPESLPGTLSPFTRRFAVSPRG